MPMLKVPNADMTPYDRLKMFIQQRGGPPAKDTFTTGPGQSLDNRLQEERGNIPNLPNVPYKGIGAGKKGQEASLWDDGLPQDPSLMEQAKQFLAAAVMDPSNVGMPGVGLTRQEAKTSIDNMLRFASGNKFKKAEQALGEVNLIDAIHPDVLEKLAVIRDTSIPGIYGRLQHPSLDSGFPVERLREYFGKYHHKGTPNPQLAPRGFFNEGKPSLLYNLENMEQDFPVQNIKSTLQHEVEHANHLYGGAVPQPSYDMVKNNRQLAEALIADTHGATGEDIDLLKYYFSNPQESLAEVGARRVAYPNEMRRAITGYTSNPSDIQLLDPVYYQSLLDFMKK